MQFQFDITSGATPPAAPQTTESVPELLRLILEVQREHLSQMLEVQREQLAQTKAAAQDAMARWKNLLSRWQKEFPEFTVHCKQAYPLLEKIYVHMLVGMVEDLAEQGEDGYDTDFAVQDFLDRYGMKLGQLSHLMTIVGPLAEAASQG